MCISVGQKEKNGRMEIVKNDQLHIKMCRKTMLQFLYLKENFSCKSNNCVKLNQSQDICAYTQVSQIQSNPTVKFCKFCCCPLRFFDFVLLKFSGQIAAVYSFTGYLAKLVNKVKI